MEVADGEAEPRVGLEPATGGDHDDPGRLERVVPGEHQLPMIVPSWQSNSTTVKLQVVFIM